MIDVLQVVFLACFLVALVLLTDWRWGLLVVGGVGFALTVRWEIKNRPTRES